MRHALLATLANKHKTSIGITVRRLKAEVKDGDSTLKVLLLTRKLKDGQRPLIAMFGGISMTWRQSTVLDDRPKKVFNGLHSEIVIRLLAQEYELYGTTKGPFQVHHVRRLAHLSSLGRKNLWIKRMASRTRKTLVTCIPCHEEIHRDRSGRDQKRRHRKAG